MDISKINSTAYLQKNFDEFENLDFWQLKKILELIEKARNMPKEEELEEIADLQDEINNLQDRLDDVNDEYNYLEEKHEDLKKDYDELEKKYDALKEELNDI